MGPIAVLVAFGVSMLPAQSFDSAEGVARASASLQLVWIVTTLITSLALYLRWRLTGEAPIGLLAAAFAVISVPLLPLAITDMTSPPHATLSGSHPLVHLAIMLGASWLLARAVRTPPVDSTLRPLRLLAVYGIGLEVVVVAISGAAERGALPQFGPAGTSAVEFSVGLVAVGFAWAFVRRARALARPTTTRLAAVFLGLGLGSFVSGLGHIWLPPFAVLAGHVRLLSVVLMGVLSVFLLRSVLEFNALRMLSLSMRAASAEEVVRREQERLHELRATIAGIRSASGAITRYEHSLDEHRKRRLEQMMTAELSRLERLLTADDDLSQPGPVMLDDVIRPLVVRHREQGMTLHWRPSSTCALMRADEVAELINILLTNAHHHAPGAAVEIAVEDAADTVRVLVRDEGPGIPSGVAAHIFDRGARGSVSSGQGLGLHIAARLAHAQGGRIALAGGRPAGGACFELTLRAASGREELPVQDLSVREDV